MICLEVRRVAGQSGAHVESGDGRGERGMSARRLYVSRSTLRLFVSDNWSPSFPSSEEVRRSTFSLLSL